ncbi:MAG: hypothetical protein HY255_02185 [Betaproteobacteria bacterium]|nr:hypothetical protein [Betaproteobacteria bacterium]
MKQFFTIALTSLLFLLTACESTRIIRQGNTLSTAGKAYADAMAPLADLVLKERIDRKSKRLADERKNFTTEQLLKYPPAAYQRFVEACAADKSLNTPGKQRACIDGQILDAATAEMRDYQGKLETFKQHTHKLAEYFVALNGFMNADAKSLGQSALQDSATGLQSLGVKLETSFQLSAGQIAGLQALGGVVFSQMQGNDARQLLDEQVPMIGRQLALQEAALQEFAAMLEQERKRDQLSLENTYVRPAFQANTDKTPRPDLPPDWVTKWTAVVTDQSAIPVLRTARAAVASALRAWKAYVEGKGNFKDMLDDLNATQSGIDALQKIYDSR